MARTLLLTFTFTFFLSGALFPQNVRPQPRMQVEKTKKVIPPLGNFFCFLALAPATCISVLREYNLAVKKGGFFRTPVPVVLPF
jgi:hypothetical protein